MPTRDPLLLEIPEEILTPRLRMIAPALGDGPALAESIGASFDHIHRWLPWAASIPTPEESEINVRQSRSRFLLRTELRYHLWLQPEHRFVGCVGLHHIDWRVPAVEVGYWSDVRFQGQGLITEALSALVAMALDTLGAHRVSLRCDPLNERSMAVARRTGFHLEGVLKNDDIAYDGSDELRDTALFAITR